MNVQGFLYILAAAFMWGLIGVFTKYILAEGISALEIAFWRASIAWVMFLVHASWQRQIKVHRTDLPALLGFGFICVTLFYGSYQLAIRDVGIALAAVLLYTAPAWVALMSWLVLKEKMTKTKTACVAMTIFGVVCISLGPQLMGNGSISLNWFGLTAGLVAGFTYALYYIFGKAFLYRYPTPTIFVYGLPFGAALLFPFVDFSHKSVEAWMLLAGLAAVTSYGAFSAYYAGLKRMDATHASVIATFEPVVAAVFAYFLFGEKFSMLGYAGSCLIIAAPGFPRPAPRSGLPTDRPRRYHPAVSPDPQAQVRAWLPHIVILAALVAAMMLLVKVVAPLFEPILLAGAVAILTAPVLCAPLIRWTERLLPGMSPAARRKLAGIAATLTLVLLAVSPLIFTVVSQAENLSDLIDKVRGIVTRDKATIDGIVDAVVAQVELINANYQRLKLPAEEIGKTVRQFLAESSDVNSAFLSFLFAGTGTLAQIALALISLTYFNIDGPRLASVLLGYAPLTEEQRSRLVDQHQRVVLRLPERHGRHGGGQGPRARGDRVDDRPPARVPAPAVRADRGRGDARHAAAARRRDDGVAAVRGTRVVPGQPLRGDRAGGRVLVGQLRDRSGARPDRAPAPRADGLDRLPAARRRHRRTAELRREGADHRAVLGRHGDHDRARVAAAVRGSAGGTARAGRDRCVASGRTRWR